MDGFERGQLPAETSSFVGRRAEAAAVEDMVRRHRLVTIVGTGGCGKTRLALEVARATARRFREGARFIGLGDIDDARELPAQFARLLGGESGEARNDCGVAISITGRETLVVVDNCEHVAEACARLVLTMLEQSAEVHVLATSREPLRVPGEVVFALGPMTLPGADIPPAETRANEAVRLFFERAREHGSELETFDQNVRLAATLCRELDGLPLAIELAAALERTVGLEALVALAEDGLPLDAEGERTSARHRSMRSAVAWSHALLTPEERKLFARVAVFRGGFSLGAALDVCSAPDQGLSRDGVVLALGGLVAKSLVLARGDDGERRFSMLEPVRQYAAEVLAIDPSVEDLRARHASHYAMRLRGDGLALGGGGRRKALDAAAQEIDNLRAALAWSLREGSDARAIDVGVELAAKLFAYWHFRGSRAEGLRWTERAAEMAGSRRDGAVAELLRVAGELAWLIGKGDLARRRLRQSIELWREVGNRTGLAYALQAIAPLETGDRRWLAVEESLAIFDAEGDHWGEALARFDGGIIALQDGLHDAAGSWMADALHAFQRLGDDWFAAQVLNHLGDVARNAGDLSLAARRYAEALDLCREDSDAQTLRSSVLSNLGATEAGRGRTRRALDYYRLALRLFRDRGDARGVAECLNGIGTVRIALHQAKQGVALLAVAESLMSSTNTQPWTANLEALERTRAVAREALSGPEFERAWAHGSARTLAEVIAEVFPEDRAGMGEGRDRLPLTGREREVAELMARGMSNRGIAEQLVITEGTAGLHAKRVLQKLGCRSRAEVAAVMAKRVPGS